MFKSVEAFEYNSGYYEVWFDTITRIYLVNELVTDMKFYFTNRTHYRHFLENVEEEYNRDLI